MDQRRTPYLDTPREWAPSEPGERLTRETLDYMSDSLAHGGQVRGASDRTLRTVRVVAGTED